MDLERTGKTASWIGVVVTISGFGWSCALGGSPNLYHESGYRLSAGGGRHRVVTREEWVQAWVALGVGLLGLGTLVTGSALYSASRAAHSDPEEDVVVVTWPPQERRP